MQTLQELEEHRERAALRTFVPGSHLREQI
jgi:hypothetical protein